LQKAAMDTISFSTLSKGLQASLERTLFLYLAYLLL
jgi:hypothetical protein